MLTAADRKKSFVEKGDKGKHQRIGVEVPIFTLDQGEGRLKPVVCFYVMRGKDREKRGGGKVMISTQEDAENYIIQVSDTGCGYDPSKPKDDGKMHVGIENVKQRLSNMCAGSLTIESEIGIGTLATIRIPKGGGR